MEQYKLQPNQLQETHFHPRKQSSTSQNLSDLNDAIEKLIANHRRHNNVRRSYAELQEIEQNFREFFEGLQKSSLVGNDTIILDELCRKVNEDAVLMHIRDSNTNERQHHEEGAINLPLRQVKQMSLPPSPLQRRHHHERVMSALLQPKSVFSDVPNIFSQDLDENNDAWTSTQNTNTERIDEMEEKIAEAFIESETERRGSDSLSEIKHLFTQMKREFDEHRVEHAHEFLEEIDKIAQDESSSEEVKIYIRNRFEEQKMMVEDIRCSYQEIKKALFELDDEKGYELEKAKKNAVIKYKNLPGGGVAVKIEATIDLPLFNLIALYYEPEGYAKWTPFCKESKLLNRLTRASNVFYLKWDLPPPVSNRDGYLIGSGFDRFDINGSILMLARTVHSDPKLVERYGLNCFGKSKLTKMEIPYVGVELTPLTESKTKLRLVSTFDPKIAFIPLSLTSWVARKGASYLLDTIIKHAANLSGAQWEQSLKNSRDFYDWLKKLIDKHLNTNTAIGGGSN